MQHSARCQSLPLLRHGASGDEIGTKGLSPCAMLLAIVGVRTWLASILTLGRRMVVRRKSLALVLLENFGLKPILQIWRYQKRNVRARKQNKKEEGKFWASKKWERGFVKKYEVNENLAGFIENNSSYLLWVLKTSLTRIY